MNTEAAQTMDAKRALWRMVADDLIDRRQVKVIQAANSIIEAYFKPFNDKLGGKNKPGSKPRLERNQLTNLENVAGETRSVAIIADYVRYQMGRDNKQDDAGRTWRARIILSGQQVIFGNAVLNQIETVLKEEAQKIVDEAKSKGVAPNNEADEVAFISWLLARRFVSYLEHSFVHQETEYEERRKAHFRSKKNE